MPKEATTLQPVPTTVQQKFVALRTELRSGFYERDFVIDGMLTAIVAGEHILLLGPPGTAKSMVTDVSCQSIDAAEYFEWLLTKFSTPEEIFGAPSIKALRDDDKYIRKTTGKLPEAHIAFVDEVFKANSSILNSMLKVINERTFSNDGVQHVPLISMVGASNELPEGSELEALFDRFLLRFWVDYIADRDKLKAMLVASDPKTTTRITLDEVRQAQAEARGVSMPEVMLDTLLDVKAATERAGVRASDRRWKKIVKALRAVAWLSGDTSVNEDHFDALPDMLWREPKERPALVQEVGKVANPLAAKATQILDAAREVFGGVPDQNTAKKVEFLTAAGEANAAFEEMENELSALIQANPAKTRRLDDAMAEIKSLHKETQRKAAQAAGVHI